MSQERIKLKAQELFRVYGIKAVTMDEISTQLGISKKTLYQSFKNKNDLVDNVIIDILDQTKTSCGQCRHSAENAVHELFSALKVMDEVMATANPTILFDLERWYPKTYKRFQEYKNDFLYNLIYENIVWGKRDGLYREDIDEELYCKVRLEMIIMSLNDQLFPRIKYNFLQIQRGMMFLFLHAMVTPAGLKLFKKYLNPPAKR